MARTVTIQDTFRGPMDLLLHLIRRDEIDINDIPVARLTQSFLEELEKLDFIDVDEAAEFLDMSSRLLEIKGRMLLPPDEAPADGEDELADDPRAGLVEALLEYRRFKDAAKMLGDLAEEHARRFPRVSPPPEFPPDGAGSASAADLLNAFQSLLTRLLPQDQPTEIASSEVSTETRIRQIEEVLSQTESTRFSLLLSSRPTRDEMVGFFMAVLELVRLGKLTARQSSDFGDIVIERRLSPVAAPDRPGVARRFRPVPFPPPPVRRPKTVFREKRRDFLAPPAGGARRAPPGRAVPSLAFGRVPRGRGL